MIAHPLVEWFGSVENVAKAIIAVAAAVAALWHPVKKVRLARRAKLNRINAYRARNDEMHQMVTTLADDMRIVKAEVRENGGSSLKDRVNSLHEKIGMVDAARRVGDHRAIWERRITKEGWEVTNHLSPAWTRITGMTRESMDNGGWTSCISPSDRTRVLAAHNLAIEDAVLFQSEYLVVNVLSGTQAMVAHDDTPVFAGAQLIGWISYIRELPKP